MDVKESLERFGLVPADEALPEIRTLLAQEADAERKGMGISREEDLALLCCVQLFARGQSEDVLRIWDAKSAGMDLGCLIDVQLLCGAGIEETKLFLESHGDPAAMAALSRIRECENVGDFQTFSPADHLTHYREYFGV
jgi:hypothetical protein